VTDGDFAPFSDITSISLEADAETAAFVYIDSNGDVRLSQPLDAEVLSTFTFKLSASDSGTPALVGEAKFVVNIIDVNEFTPTLNANIFDTVIDDSTEFPLLLFTVSAIDEDRDTPPLLFETSTSLPVQIVTLSASTAEVMLLRRVPEIERHGSFVHIPIAVVDTASPSRFSNGTAIVVFPEKPQFILSSTAGFIVNESIVDHDTDQSQIGFFVNSLHGLASISYVGTNVSSSIEVSGTASELVLRCETSDTVLYVNTIAGETESPVSVAVALSSIAPDSTGAIAPVSVSVTLDESPISALRKEIYLNILSGAEVVSFDVPASWFSSVENRTVRVSAVTGHINATLSITLHKTGLEDLSMLSETVAMIVPSGTYYAGDSLVLPIIARTARGVSKFKMTLETTETIAMLSWEEGSPDWHVISQEHVTCDNLDASGAACTERLILLGITKDTQSKLSEETHPLLNLVVEIRSRSSTALKESISCVVSMLEDSYGDTIGYTPFQVHSADYRGSLVQRQALIRVTQTDYISVFAASSRTEFIDTEAVLGQTSVGSLEVWAFSRRLSSLIKLTGDISCEAPLGSGFAVNSQCTELSVIAGSAPNGSDIALHVQHKPTGLVSSVRGKIWKLKLPINLKATHETLSPIAGWSDSSCSGTRFQTTNLAASCLITDGTSSFTADVTDVFWTQIESSNASVADISPTGLREIVGVSSPGETEFSIKDVLGSTISTSAKIGTLAEPVHIVGALSTAVVAPSPTLFVSSSSMEKEGQHPLVISRTSQFVKPDETAQVISYAILSDSRLMSLSQVHTESVVDDNTVIESLGNTFAPLANGATTITLTFFDTQCGKKNRLAKGSAALTSLLNKRKPEFVPATNLLEIVENVQSNFRIGQVQAVDRDSGREDPIIYGLTKARGLSAQTGNYVDESFVDMFSIDGVSGTLQAFPGPHLDYEIYHSFAIGIVVSNYVADIEAAVASGTVSDTASYVEIVVNVTDANDNFPVFTRDMFRVRAVPDGGENFVVGAVFASDEDSSDNGRISYSLASISEPEKFGDSSTSTLQVHESTGILTVKRGNADNGTISPGMFSAVAQDNGSPSLYSVTNVSLEVYDANRLIYVDMCLDATEFSAYKDQFAVIVGSQLSVSLFAEYVIEVPCRNVSGGKEIITADSGSSNRAQREVSVPKMGSRILAVQLKDKYAGIGRLALMNRLQDSNISQEYGEFDATAMVELVLPFSFKNAFGVDAFVGRYSDLMRSRVQSNASDSVGGNGTGNGNEDALGANETNASASISLGVMIAIAVVVCVLIAGLVVIAYRKQSHEKQVEPVINLDGFKFSFSGGEVDPETGNAFFAQPNPTHYHPDRVAETRFEASTLSAQAKQQGFISAAKDPLSPLNDKRELAADFDNPLYAQGTKTPGPFVGFYADGKSPLEQSNTPLPTNPSGLWVSSATTRESALVDDFESYLSSM
jgi:hypothetical protein